jgi:hypothetical protein
MIERYPTSHHILTALSAIEKLCEIYWNKVFDSPLLTVVFPLGKHFHFRVF